MINKSKPIGLQKVAQYRSIIEELENILPVKNKHNVIESRAVHVISSAQNLIQQLQAHYPQTVADDLIKRLVKSIITGDSAKFLRRLNQLKKQDGLQHDKK